MRITEIELNNFRAFYGKHTLSLDKDGKNLMIYGENGSGKSSFFIALKTFFESSNRQVNLKSLENIFLPASQKESVYLQFKIKQDSKSSSETIIKIDSVNNEIIGSEKVLVSDANRAKGFFDYKSLLRTHLVDTAKVNLFELLITEILSEQENRISGKLIGKEYREIIHDSHKLKQGTWVVKAVKEKIESFNVGLTEKLQSIENDTNTFIKEFGYNIQVKLNFNGIVYAGRRDVRNQNITVEIEFCSQPLPEHQHFLNEAKLSALAISMYLAAVKSNPTEGVLKTLVLDDLLIGLDMSNRLPLLNIVRDHFQDRFQIIMTTYDKIWFELVKNYFGMSNWKYVDIYSRKLTDSDFEMPLIKQNTDYIEKAQEYLVAKDYKASAVYVRSEFEKLVSAFCDKNNLLVKFKTKSKELKSDDFWNAIITQTNIDEHFVSEVETCRGTVMNPFSHHDLEKPEFEAELIKAIAIVKKLKNPTFSKDDSKTVNKLQIKINDLILEIAKKVQTIEQMSAQLKAKS